MYVSNPCVFVGGCPRSGTTLLQRMLNHHPDLVVANDVHFIPRALEKTDRQLLTLGLQGNPIPMSPELREAAWNYHRFVRLGLSRAQFDDAARDAESYQQLVRRLFDTLANLNRKRYAGEKTPDYVLSIPLLRQMFPQARFVNLVRDGRDVTLSLLDWATPTKGPGRLAHWATDPMATCALWWRRFVEAGEAARDNRVLSVRYEDLLADVEGTLVTICHHLHLDHSPQMAAFHVGKADSVDPRPSTRAEGISAKRAWLPATSGLRDWRDQMAPHDVAVFEAIAGPALKRMGYSCSHHALTGSQEERVRQAELWWAELEQVRQTRRVGSSIAAVPSTRDPHEGDSQLIARDRQLPNLRLVLDNGALQDAIRRNGGDDAGAPHITYVRYKPGTNCWSAFEVMRGGQLRRYIAICHHPGAHDKLANLSRYIHSQSVDDDLCFVDKTRQLIVLPFPLDPRLPALTRLFRADDEQRQAMLRQLQLVSHGQSLGLSLLSYKPARRGVVRVDVDHQPRWVIRFNRPHPFLGAKQAAKWLAGPQRWRQAARVGQSDRHHAIAVDWLEGESLGNCPGSADFLREQAVDVGRLLSQVHATPHPKMRVVTLPEIGSWVESTIAMLAFLSPRLGNDALWLATTIDRRLRAIPHRYSLIHGDFHPGQLLRGSCQGVGAREPAAAQDERFGIVDWDRSSNGPVGLDIATFAAAVLTSSLRPSGAWSLPDAQGTVATFMDGYRQSTPRVPDQDFDCFVALGLMQTAVIPFRQRWPDWIHATERILALAREYLMPARVARSTATISESTAKVTHQDNSATPRWLSVAIDPESVRQKVLPCVATWLDKATDLALEAIVVRNINPKGRCLLEYQLAYRDVQSRQRATTVIGKVREKGPDLLAAHVQHHLFARVRQAAGILQVAQPLGSIPEWNLWLQSMLPGREATSVLTPSSPTEASHMIGRALAELHRLKLPAPRSHGLEDELAILHVQLRRVAVHQDSLLKRLDRVFQICQELLTAEPGNSTTGIHRDFHPGQVLLHEGRVQLVDFDLFAEGDPAVDAGNFLAHLRELGVREHGDPRALHEHELAFIDGYCGENPVVTESSIQRWSYVSFARHIAISSRIRSRRHATLPILEACERQLQLSDPRQVARVSS